jgi:Lrp/AsnC family transcriptional regulator for asnA, asnC and gidA
MDKTDYLILSEMLKNSKISLLKVANKLEISPLTVKKRFERMLADGVIRKASISIDLSKLGYEGKVFMLITNMPGKGKAVTIDALKKIRNIILVSEIIGPVDILVYAPVSDIQSVRNIITEVKKLSSVQHVEIVCTNSTMFPISPSYGKLMSQRALELAKTSK